MKKAVNFTLIFQSEPEGGYTATVANLPGVVSFGDTIEAAEKNIREAIGLHIENLQAHNAWPPEIGHRVFTGTLTLELAE